MLLTMRGISQPVDSIKFGSGGGVSGRLILYKITSSCIKKGSGLTSIKYTSSSKLKKKEFNSLKAHAKDLLLNSQSVNKPYNTYQFLEIFSKEKTVKYIWGDPTFKTPAQIEKFYNELNSLAIKKIKQ